MLAWITAIIYKDTRITEVTRIPYRDVTYITFSVSIISIKVLAIYHRSLYTSTRIIRLFLPTYNMYNKHICTLLLLLFIDSQILFYFCLCLHCKFHCTRNIPSHGEHFNRVFLF